MKKIISVVLALTMIMMLGISSFAAISGPDADNTAENKTGNTIVTTYLDPDKTDGYETYEVTIPPSFTITWNDTAVKAGNLNYGVTAQLYTGATLEVYATASNATHMVNSGGEQLAYTSTGIGTTNTGVFNAKGAATTAPADMAIYIPSFAGVSIADDYAVTFTYHVSYVPAPTTTP